MRYRITGLDAARAVAIQEMDALDESDARRQAHSRGLEVLSVQGVRLKLSRRGRRLALVPFTQELIALLEAGLSLVEAIDGLTEKERDATVRALLEGLRARLYEGQSLSAALGAFPATFPALYVSTVRASERSGAISEALQRFVTYQDRIDVLKRQLINASIYPAVLLGVGALVVIFLVVYVVPRFSGIYEEIGGDLPLASKLLMQWGRLLDAHGAFVLGGAVAAATVLAALAARPGTRAALGRAIAGIPAIRRQLQLYQLARLYRTCGMLLRGGIPVVTAFDMTLGLLAAAAQPRLAAATRAVREGQSLTDSLTRHGLTTPVGERMLRVGERSGNMGEMMERVAAFYDAELSRWVEVATRLIEPVMMAVIGLLIGGIVVLMYFPIFELAGSIR
ncbi:MAG TPA: type II secretion system F family protein [Steroidobacteraceae bacterium]|jgi:general secretion pathway protein F|nr:type II secretion system F family protein [Steroidobacteraceae bacterium]